MARRFLTVNFRDVSGTTRECTVYGRDIQILARLFLAGMNGYRRSDFPAGSSVYADISRLRRLGFFIGVGWQEGKGGKILFGTVHFILFNDLVAPVAVGVCESPER